MKIKFLLIIFFLTLTCNAFGTIICDDLFATDPIEDTIRDLAKLRLQLDLAQTSNTTSLALAALEGEFRVKENRLRIYLEKNKILSYADLVKKIGEQIFLLQNPIDKTEQIREREARLAVSELEDLGKVGSFFTVGEGSHKFKLMNTKTTQLIWYKVATLINTKLKGVRPTWKSLKKQGVVIAPRTHQTRFLGDLLPMNSITYADVELWLKGLNELSRKGTSELKQIFKDHTDGDFYYLPRRFEVEMIREAARFDDYSLEKIAWVMTNSGRELHPVGEKQPVFINREPFYDLLGLVREMFDCSSEKIPRYGFRGRLWGTDFARFSPFYDEQMHEGMKGFHGGFRIARAVRKK